jgi:hypothetical protein
MNTLRGFAVLCAYLCFSTSAQAGNPFDQFVGSGSLNGTMELVGKSAPDPAHCSRNARAVGDNALSFSLSCSGGRSFSLSCSFRAANGSMSGSCSVGFAHLNGSGTIRGSTIHLSMRSNVGSDVRMSITPRSLSLNSANARYIKALRIRG